MRVKEYRDACKKGDTWKVCHRTLEHRLDQQHQVDWDGTSVLYRTTRHIQLKLKEALHIEWTTANTRLNRDRAMSYQAARSPRRSGQLIATGLITLAWMLRLLHRTSCRSHTYKNTSIFASRFIFAMMTRSFCMFLLSGSASMIMICWPSSYIRPHQAVLSGIINWKCFRKRWME